MSSAPHAYLDARLSPENKAVLLEVLAHLKGPGNPNELEVAPAFIGQEYYDTADEQFYKATGSGWKRITSDNP